MSETFYRISRLPPYVFSEVTALKAAALQAGRDIIDLGVGSPDSPPPAHVLNTLKQALADPEASRYSFTPGIKELREAQASYYARRFNVTLDPDKEIVVCIGSKEGISSLTQTLAGPEDSFVVPDPCYPIHHWGFVLAGAKEVLTVPHYPDSRMLEALEKIFVAKPRPPRAVFVNFPSNPTTVCADLAFYEELVSLCRHYGVYVISDLAYCEIYFDGTPPPSILQVEGAKEVAVEFTTVSKTYSMAGWRIGFAAGNPQLISAMSKIKSYCDYGTFIPVQRAAGAALTGPQDYVDDMRNLYKKRRNVLVTGAKEAGWQMPSPAASMFIWAPLPEKCKAMGSLEFSKALLEKADVAVSPGIGFGPGGEGYVRIALVENEERLRRAVKNIKRFLADG